jgi:hypothetical protein
MVPQSFLAFFAASTGAGAALVGLLFVAVSIAPEQTVAGDAPVAPQAMAASTFTALINAFFVSLVALLPGEVLGSGTIVMSSVALVNSLSLAWNLFKEPQSGLSALRRSFLVLAGIAIYGFELYNGVQLQRFPKDPGPIYAIAPLLIGVYGLGLTRAWQLLGAQRFGLMGWLSVMREVQPRERARETTAAPVAAAPSDGRAGHDDAPRTIEG